MEMFGVASRWMMNASSCGAGGATLGGGGTTTVARGEAGGLPAS